jgi:S-DNA-T family DNA segregation ATPase FtsK/SpoIIIE
MARTRTKTRKPRTGTARFAWDDREAWKRRALYISVLTMLLSGGLVIWEPPALQRLLDPVWRFGGLSLFAVPAWSGALYLAIRTSPGTTFHLWQWWVGSFLLLAAVIAIPNAFGGINIGWTPFHSEVGGFVSGDPGTGAWLRLLALVTGAFVLVFPRLVAAALANTATGAERLYETTAERARDAAERRRNQREQHRSEPVVSIGQPKKKDEPDSEVDSDELDWDEESEEDLTEARIGPRIVLPHPPSAENESDPLTDEDMVVDEDEAEEPEEAGAMPQRPTAESDPSPADAPMTVAEYAASQNPFTTLPDVRWNFPPVETFTPEPDHEIDHDAQLATASSIESTLGEYGIEAHVTEVRPGPTVTLFGLRPGWIRRYKEIKEKDAGGNQTTRREEVGKTRVKLDRIAALDRDLALHLKAPSIRLEAPIPGTNLIGLEVPNVDPHAVHIRTLLQSEVFRRLRSRSKLAIPLGKGSGGEPVVADLARMPHLLVAGATGSGKSVFVNSVINALLWHSNPQDVRMILIDPKRVELTVYNGIPHLITPVIVETNQSLNALRWLIMQMEERLRILSDEGARDINSYNEKREGRDRLPFLVLVIDELADLMMTTGKAFEQALVRLAQMGRATGIHLVVATQRPSVDVITGLIKANFPTRVSFMVTALVDSRTILDAAGAEKLLGRGDMLYLPQDAARPARIQSAFVSEDEAAKIAQFWRDQANGYVPPELPDLLVPEELLPKGRGSGANAFASLPSQPEPTAVSSTGDVEDAARELAELYDGKISTSLLQRRLGIGYPRAARLRDLLVKEGLASAGIPNAPAETGGRGRRAVRNAARNEEPDP